MYDVMLVDDEPAMIESMRRHFEKFPDFNIIYTCYMISDAKMLFEKKVPDLLFTDIKMPGGTGMDLIRHVTENYPRCVIIVVSGYDTFEYVRGAFLYGIEDYLLKPVSPAQFAAFIEKLKIKLDSREHLAQAVRNRNAPNDSGAAKRLTPEERVLSGIEEYLLDNLHSENSISQVCREFSISQPYLSKIFRKYKDCSYNEYLVALRISRAKHLLIDRQDLLLGSIAALTGFSDQFYFSRVFKQHVGISPSEFRKGLDKNGFFK